MAYKSYKNLFEKLKKNSKRSNYQDKLKKCKDNIKCTWKIMKEIVGKANINKKKLGKTTCNK